MSSYPELVLQFDADVCKNQKLVKIKSGENQKLVKIKGIRRLTNIAAKPFRV